jgi:ATP-dependent helicase/nuclease subunit A
MTAPVQQTFRFAAPALDAKPPRSNIVIEAGAGTGKTSAIVAEVLKLLLENEDLAPERIVLMTFTEKAAGEIADRIHHALVELELHFDDERVVWPAGSPKPLFEVPRDRKDAFRAACRRQIDRIDSIRSQTIHSFCQSLLRAFPVEAGLDPQFKIVEGFERSLLYGQLYDAWLDEETRTKPSAETLRDWEFLLAHVGYLFQIRELVFSLLARRDLLSEPGHDFGGFEEIEETVRGALTAIRRGDRSQLKAGDDAGRTVMQYIQANQPPDGRDLDEWIPYFEPIATPIRKAHLPKDSALNEAFVVLRTDRKERTSSIHDRLVRHRSAVAIYALTRRFIDFLDREKRMLGVADFDDLLLRTLALLDDTNVLERVRGQFDYIFVDEFQDTDRTQARIIDRLARDRSGNWVPGRTIVVGDPKQSIYGFRRADPEMYRDMTDAMIQGGADHRVLRDQYRSDPPLLDAINAMFETVFGAGAGQSDDNVFRPSYHRLNAGRERNARELDARFTFLSGTDEAEAIAQWILKHRDGTDRDLQRFAILFRRLTRLDDYLDVFDRYGIAYVLPPTKAFLDRRAPVDAVAVLRAIAFPFDRGAEISAARTPYFGLSDEEIATGIVEQDSVATGFSPSSDGLKPVTTSWIAFRQTLAAYRKESEHLTVAGILDLLVQSADIETIYAMTADGHRAARHLERLRSLAFEYDQKIGGSPRQFVDEIARRREEPDDMEPSLADDDSNAVRIMSVHAAKGLEFETVILPDLAFRSRGSGDEQQLFSVEAPPSLVMTGRAQSISAHYRFTAGGAPVRIKKIIVEREEAEARRLFYVAVTRAKTDVVFVTDGNFRGDGFLKCLAETFAFDKASFATLWDGGRIVRDHDVNGQSVAVAFERIDPAQGGTAARQASRLRDAALERELRDGPIMPLTMALPPAAPSLDRGEAAAARQRSKGRTSGLLLHRFLELWDGKADAGALLRRLAVEAAADADTIGRVRRRIETLRQSPSLQRMLSAETIAREMPVTLVEGGAIVQRRIDRLIRENGRYIVVDYKSGQSDGARLERDRAQVSQYCAAVAAMTGADCGALLWYIDLDRDVLVESRT